MAKVPQPEVPPGAVFEILDVPAARQDGADHLAELPAVQERCLAPLSECSARSDERNVVAPLRDKASGNAVQGGERAPSQGLDGGREPR